MSDPRALVGRAELVRCLAALPAEAENFAASLLGLQAGPIAAEKKTGNEPKRDTPVPDQAPVEETKQVAQESLPVNKPAVGLRFWRVASVEDLPAAEDVDWYAGAKPLTAEELNQVAESKPHQAPPLTPWPRLFNHLEVALVRHPAGRHLDVPRAVALLAGGGQIKDLPRRPVRLWQENLLVLVDRAPHLAPYWDDMRLLIDRLIACRGTMGLKVIHLPSGPWGPWLDWFTAESHPRRINPEHNLLIVGDLGRLAYNPSKQQQWDRFLTRSRPKAACLLPHGADPTIKKVGGEIMFWERATRPTASVLERQVNHLLALMSATPRLSFPLLRALRRRFGFGSAVEARVHNHAHVQSDNRGLAIAPAWLATHRQAFLELPLATRERFLDLIQEHHRDLSPARQLIQQVLTQELTGLRKQDLPLTARLAATLDQGGSMALSVARWFTGTACLHPPSTWERRDMKTLLEKSMGFDTRLPPGFQPGSVKHVSSRQWYLCREGYRLVWRSKPKGANQVCRLSGDEYYAHVGGAWRKHKLEEGAILDTGNLEFLLLSGGRSKLRLEAVTKPAWAQAMGQDQEGLFIQVDQGARRLYWQPPYSGELGSASPPRGFWVDQEPYRQWQSQGMVKPQWASDWGQDQYGFYADLSVGDVVQRMRWIWPGVFTMGSPPGEPDRRSDEEQHQVLLTRGFWLADTACSLALWKAVMGENPSRFKGADLPVERVSWEKVQDFLRALAKKVQGLSPRLPSEAEWEYACRAGSTTAFSFSGDLTTDLVNYDGNYPYADGPKGEYRERTLPVDALPANPWGLYHMHGNVWEWCADWYGDYPNGLVTDPSGPADGSARVMRGGSWDDVGRLLRSACRVWDQPGNAWHFAGFRLASGC